MLRSPADSALRALLSTFCRGRLSLTQPGGPAAHQPGWTRTAALHSSSAATGPPQHLEQQQTPQQQAHCYQQQQQQALLRQPAALWQACKRRPAAAVGDNSRAAFHSKPDVATDQADERLSSSNLYASSSSSSSSSGGGGGGHARPRPLPAAGRAQRRAAAHSYLAAATQRMEAATPQPCSASLADHHHNSSSSSSSMGSLLAGQPDLVMPQVLAAAADRLGTPPLHTSSIRRPPSSSLGSSSRSSRGDSSSSDGDDSSSSSSTGNPASSSSSSTGVRRAPLSNMLAAAAQRLAASPQAVSSRLRTLQANSSSSSSNSSSGAASVQAHTRHSLPAVELDGQQQQMLDKAIAVIDRLRARGYSAFIAGGWVRDAYLGRRAADIDIATSAPPFKVRGIFQGDPMVDLPRSTVKLTHQGEVFELSFFKGISRTSSLFSVGMDAACRDFTINALYYDPATNEVLDFVGGVADARSRTLRLTADDAKRLADDPLRVLRGVRFATVLGLKLAPGTAVAMGQHAAACSLNAGVPPRRIWLELRKLAKAEAGQPGSWPHALRLSFHLGLLPHLFPWLQQQQQQNPSSNGSSSGSTVIDPFGYGVSKGASSSSGAGAGGISNGGRAVLVAERLSQLWQQQQQQEPGAAAEGLPLPLLVAATVHPSAESFAAAEPYLQQLFPSQQEWDSIQALKTATQLLRGSPETSTTSTTTTPSSSSSEAGPAAGADGWAQFYCHPHAGLVLMVLSCWMPEALAAGFLRTHQARMAASRRR